MAEVLAQPGQDNIDIMPLSWLIERGCTHCWGDEAWLKTPTGRKLSVDCWHRMPYLTAEQKQQVFDDLPAPHVRGRSGRSAGRRVAATGIFLGPRGCAVRLPPPAPRTVDGRSERESV